MVLQKVSGWLLFLSFSQWGAAAVPPCMHAREVHISCTSFPENHTTKAVSCVVSQKVNKRKK